MRAPLLLALVPVAWLACGRVASSPPGDVVSGGGGGACAAAGGTCVLGSVACTAQAPTSSQDCETDPSDPAGSFCCLDEDAGADAGLTCDEQSGEAQRAVDALVSELPASDESCVTDSDCTVVMTTTACSGTCQGVQVNQAGATQLAAALAKISATTCAGYAANGCPSPCCVPCPPQLEPSCVSGTCSYASIYTDGDASSDAAGQ